jgi:hypothetical protein
MAVKYLPECDDENNNDISVSDYNEASGDNHLLLNELPRVLEKTSTKRDVNIALWAGCSKKVRVENVSSLRKGQHISSMPGQYATKLRIYQHHAIIKKIRYTSGTRITMEVIHFNKEGTKIEINQSDKTYDLVHDELYIIEYLHPRYTADEIVRRAESMLPTNNDGQHKFGTYFPFTNNCEHFATWCVVGEKESLQCESLRKKIVNLILKTFDENGIIQNTIHIVYLIYRSPMLNEFRKKHA